MLSRADPFAALQLTGELRVGLLPGVAKLFDQRGLGCRVEMIGRIDDGLAAAISLLVQRIARLFRLVCTQFRQIYPPFAGVGCLPRRNAFTFTLDRNTPESTS